MSVPEWLLFMPSISPYLIRVDIDQTRRRKIIPSSKSIILINTNSGAFDLAMSRCNFLWVSLLVSLDNEDGDIVIATAITRSNQRPRYAGLKSHLYDLRRSTSKHT
jgi:hypothetical protein